MDKEFKVPEMGENVESATVSKVLISEGDTISKDQPVVELETDKAAMEVPSTVEGVVGEILVKEGDEVTVGQALFRLSSQDGATDDEASAKSEDSNKADGKKAAESEKPEAESSPKRKKTEPEPKPEPEIEPKSESEPEPEPEAESQPEEPSGQDAEKPATPPSGQAAKENAAVAVPAAPSVRRLAREIGVDINSVKGSGPAGRISIDDVKAYARSRADERPRAAAGGTLALPDLSQWGEVERKPMSRVRRLTAERMSHAWSVVPHVTQFAKADVVEIERLRQQYKGEAEKAGGHLSLMAIVIKTVAGALKVFPRFNAGVDPEQHEIVYRKYYHIGVAMDTDRGLVVPVIRDVDRKNVIEIAVDLAKITTAAREGKLAVEDMRGGCFTISNAGALGADIFTPIINWPEAAILAMAHTRTEAVYKDGTFHPRLMLPLALSFDHRIVDGADGVRFIRWIVDALEEPMKLLWEG